MDIECINVDMTTKPITKYSKPLRLPSNRDDLPNSLQSLHAPIIQKNDLHHVFSIEFGSSRLEIPSPSSKSHQYTEKDFDNFAGKNTDVTMLPIGDKSDISSNKKIADSLIRLKSHEQKGQSCSGDINWVEANEDFKVAYYEESNFENNGMIFYDRAFILLQEGLKSMKSSCKQLVQANFINRFYCFKPKKLPLELENEKNLILDLHFVEYNFKCTTHFLIAKSICTSFTPGFDVRNKLVGTPYDGIAKQDMIASLQLLYALQKYQSTAKTIVAVHGIRGIIEISNMCTQISLRALASGKITWLCLLRNSCFKAANELYSGCLQDYAYEKHSVQTYTNYCLTHIKKIVRKFS